ncbi:MAG: glycosyltransferase family 92 protein [Bacteroidaceae bacterium]|jgi:hypothetical protein|nr:glycosyltransferase family 92 protein [Bacteroidaceae bacterium]
MKKIFAEIIAGIIPQKRLRDKWRGILRYGLFKAIRLKRRMKLENTSPKHYFTICAIAKNEGVYFKEWIDWHHNQGAEKFYIYDNNSSDNTKEVLEPYIKSGLVEYIFWPGTKQQLPAYDDCFERHRLESRWMAIIDLDEFIVPIKHKNIVDFLNSIEDHSVVEINWLVYGSSGAERKESGKVMDRFRKHSLPDHPLNHHVKSIVNPRCVCSMIGCHEAACIIGTTVDSHGNIITQGRKKRKPQQDVIRINHYAIKSYEEFLSKRARGRARVNSKRDLGYFERYDLNDIEE